MQLSIFKVSKLFTMRFFYLISIILTIFNSCAKKNNTYVISFSSCDNQEIENKLWPEILKNDPNIFIWGGDIIYSDTENMQLMQKNYNKQKNNLVYLDFIKKIPVLGTWDDHDYGKNDAGKEYAKKDSVQQLFLDFFDIPKDDIRRKQQGVYFSKDVFLNKNSIKIIVLDTRYFRSELTKDTITKKRYKPNTNGKGTMLGKKQWEWLENQLSNSFFDFNIIVSSVQFLSYEHGFETWGNMPHEVKKLEKIIQESKSKGVIILSGDRHIAEISSKKLPNLNYPLIDITSSGMTHSYTSYKGEPNMYRISNVVSDKNFGILKFDLSNKIVTMEIRGINNKLYESFTQQY